MPVGDRQLLIVEIVEKVLGVKAERGKRFDWLKNKHQEEDFGKYYPLIHKIFLTLHGDTDANGLKRIIFPPCDAFFGRGLNFIFEYDETQHFSTSRLKTLKLYPSDLKTNFEIGKYISLCKAHLFEADKYRSNIKPVDFKFVGGRTAQRAYLDCFKDLLPELHGLKPTLRISAFEVSGIVTDNKESRLAIRKLVKKKLNYP